MGDIIDLAAVRARKRRAQEQPKTFFRVFVSDGAVCFETPDESWWQCESLEAARSIGREFMHRAYEVEQAERRARGECPQCGARCYCPKPKFKIHLMRNGLSACGGKTKRRTTSVPEQVTCSRCKALLPRLMP